LGLQFSFLRVYSRSTTSGYIGKPAFQQANCAGGDAGVEREPDAAIASFVDLQTLKKIKRNPKMSNEMRADKALFFIRMNHVARSNILARV
jgi:hypothetical protein